MIKTVWIGTVGFQGAEEQIAAMIRKAFGGRT